MRISAKAEYACLAVIALAKRHHGDRPLPIREIAEAEGISAKFLTQILLRLKEAGLVLSTRGSSGGYRLARPPEEISLIDVLKVVDGYGITSAERNGPTAPVLADVWEQIRTLETELLSGTSIAKLVERSDIHDWVIWARDRRNLEPRTRNRTGATEKCKLSHGWTQINADKCLRKVIEFTCGSIDRFDLRLVANWQRHGFEASADGAALPEAAGLGAKINRAAGDADLERAYAIAESLLNLPLDAAPDRSFGDGVGPRLDLDRRGGLACLFRGVPWSHQPAHEGRRAS